MTTTRERLNDLCSLSLVCWRFRGPAQAALLSDAAIRAGGRGSLLLRALDSNPALSCTGIQWCHQTRRASGDTLAALLRLAKPTHLAIGSGFFTNSSPEDLDALEAALKGLGSDLRSFAFGGYDLETTTSDYITHFLSTSWTSLSSLSLRQVRFTSPHLGITQTQHDAFWRSYPIPRFSLKHLSISFVRPVPAARATITQDDQEKSWLYWLIAHSGKSLTSLELANLSEELPEDAYQLLREAVPNLRHLSITEYEGTELLGDILAGGADKLVSLTLGGLSSIGLAGNESMDVLASPTVLEGRQELQYLEIQNLQLFERLDILQAMQAGRLPHLRQIVLTNASRIHPQVQVLDTYCKAKGILLVVRR